MTARVISIIANPERFCARSCAECKKNVRTNMCSVERNIYFAISLDISDVRSTTIRFPSLDNAIVESNRTSWRINPKCRRRNVDVDVVTPLAEHQPRINILSTSATLADTANVLASDRTCTFTGGPRLQQTPRVTGGKGPRLIPRRCLLTLRDRSPPERMVNTI
jgi:hypothetical protein